MVRVIIEHKIGEWSEFEPVFREDLERRKILGSKAGHIYRDLKDPQHLFAVLDWDDPDAATEFIDGLETHEATEWATSGIWSRLYATEEVLETEA